MFLWPQIGSDHQCPLKNFWKAQVWFKCYEERKTLSLKTATMVSEELSVDVASISYITSGEYFFIER